MDRNDEVAVRLIAAPVSLSARRAWIEIIYHDTKLHVIMVALRKESVDRNIVKLGSIWCKAKVALRKESVDRNKQGRNGQNIKRSRSPQGERG